MQALTIKINGDNSQLRQSIAGTRQALAGMGSMLKGAFAGLAGIAGAIASFKTLKEAINNAAEMEGFKVSFTTLLGNANKAEKRLSSLAKFAADTPFELPEVVKASKVLETLTRGALSTGKGLTLVGDVAASTGVPFDELAITMGRLYSGLMNGDAVGDSIGRLQELGVVSSQTRHRVEALQAAGKAGKSVWNVAAAEFGRFAGEMDKKSRTWNGLWSTLQDAISGALREFGTPLIDGLKPFLQGSIKFVEQLAPAAKAAGSAVGEALQVAMQAFKDGQIGTIVGKSLMIGLKEAVNFLWRGLVGTFRAAWTVGEEMAKTMVSNLETLADGNFWKGLGNVLLGTAEKFGAAILKAFSLPLLNLQAGMVFVATKLKNGLTLAVQGPIALLKAGVAFFMQEIMSGLRKIPGMSKLIGEGDGKNLSWDEMKAEKQRQAEIESGPLDNTTFAQMKADLVKQGGANLFGLNADALSKDAGARVDSGLAGLKPFLMRRMGREKDAFTNIGKSFLSGFNEDAIFDSSGDQASLAATFSTLKDNLAEATKAAKSAPTFDGGPRRVKFGIRSDEPTDGTGGGKSGAGVIASSLARVGGGGLAAGGTVGLWRSMESHLKKIVVNTARQNGLQSTGFARTGGLKSFGLTSPA